MKVVTNYPRVSVIIPTKNEQENIAKCLSAVRSTDYPAHKVELIVVDNGSVDETTEIARRYDVKLINRPNLNVSELRNIGLEHAAGDIAVFIDADIVVTEQWLNSGVQIILDDPAICCLGGLIDIPPDSSWLERTWHLRLELLPDERYVEWVSSMNMFVRKKAFLQVGGFNNQLVTAEDVDLCLRLKQTGKIFYSRSVKVIHLGEAKSLRHFFLKERWRGQSNLRGLFSHGLHLSELPSILLPLYFLYFYGVFCPIQFLVNDNLLTALHVSLFLTIPLLRSYLICFKLRRMSSLLPLSFLWWLYYTARGLAVISPSKRRI